MTIKGGSIRPLRICDQYMSVTGEIRRYAIPAPRPKLLFSSMTYFCPL